MYSNTCYNSHTSNLNHTQLMAEHSNSPASIGWTFLTNHAHALIVISRNPDSRIREIADQIGITERAAHRIVSALVDSGYLHRYQVGRDNRYEVHADAPLRHPLESLHTVGELIEMLSVQKELSRP